MTDELSRQLAAIDQAERLLVLPRFGPEEAWLLGSQLRTAALAQSVPVAIEITRSCGQCQFATVLDGGHMSLGAPEECHRAALCPQQPCGRASVQVRWAFA